MQDSQTTDQNETLYSSPAFSSLDFSAPPRVVIVHLNRNDLTHSVVVEGPLFIIHITDGNKNVRS